MAAPTHAMELSSPCEMDMHMVRRMGMMVATHKESPIADVGPIRATLTVLITSGVHWPLALASSMPHTMPLQMEPTCASVLNRVT